MKVLVAYDGSEPAGHALTRAAQIAPGIWQGSCPALIYLPLKI